ncbi:MAG: hypothetical protein Q9210_005086 [Variospora velana]
MTSNMDIERVEGFLAQAVANASKIFSIAEKFPDSQVSSILRAKDVTLRLQRVLDALEKLEDELKPLKAKFETELQESQAVAMRDLKAQKADLEAQEADLEARRTELRQDTTNHQTAKDGLAAEEQRIATQTAKVQKDTETLRKEEQKLRDSRQEIAKAQDEVAKARHANDMEKSRLGRISAQLTADRQGLTNSSAEVSRLQSEAKAHQDQLNQERAGLSSQKREFNAASLQLQRYLTQLEVDRANLQESQDRLATTKEGLEKERDACRLLATALNQQIAEDEHKEGVRKTEHETLLRELKEQESRRKERHETLLENLEEKASRRKEQYETLIQNVKEKEIRRKEEYQTLLQYLKNEYEDKSLHFASRSETLKAQETGLVQQFNSFMKRREAEQATALKAREDTAKQAVATIVSQAEKALSQQQSVIITEEARKLKADRGVFEKVQSSALEKIAVEGDRARLREEQGLLSAHIQQLREHPLAYNDKIEGLNQSVAAMKLDQAAMSTKITAISTATDEIPGATAKIDTISTVTADALATAGDVSRKISALEDKVSNAPDTLTGILADYSKKSADVSGTAFTQLNAKLDDMIATLSGVSHEVLRFLPTMQPLEANAYDTMVGNHTKLSDLMKATTSAVDELKEAIADMPNRINQPPAVSSGRPILPTRSSQRSLAGHSKRPSDASMTEEAESSQRKSPRTSTSLHGTRRHSGSGTATPGAAASSSQPRPSSPLASRKAPIVTQETEEEDEDEEDEEDPGLPAININAPSISSTAPLIPPGVQAPHADTIPIWNQLELRGDGVWNNDRLRKLLQWLEQVRTLSRDIYRFPKAFDTCARSKKESCVKAYTVYNTRKKNAITEDVECEWCMNSGLCLRIAFAQPNPGDFDPRSTTKRWTLENRPPADSVGLDD